VTTLLSIALEINQGFRGLGAACAIGARASAPATGGGAGSERRAAAPLPSTSGPPVGHRRSSTDPAAPRPSGRGWRDMPRSFVGWREDPAEPPARQRSLLGRMLRDPGRGRTPRFRPRAQTPAAHVRVRMTNRSHGQRRVVGTGGLAANGFASPDRNRCSLGLPNPPRQPLQSRTSSADGPEKSPPRTESMGVRLACLRFLVRRSVLASGSGRILRQHQDVRRPSATIWRPVLQGSQYNAAPRFHIPASLAAASRPAAERGIRGCMTGVSPVPEKFAQREETGVWAFTHGVIFRQRQGYLRQILSLIAIVSVQTVQRLTAIFFQSQLIGLS
jgi:hypothetical protein